jgi:hypothetical protein
VSIDAKGVIIDGTTLVLVPLTYVGKYTVPAAVTAIVVGAFRGCVSLTEVDFEGGSAVTAIPDYAFYGCTSLTAVTLPSGVLTIGVSAFEKSGITAVPWTTSLTTAGVRAFADCPNLTAVAIPAGVTLGGSANGAFEDCANLANITFVGGITTIPAYMFYKVTGLKSYDLTGITTINEHAFDSSGLTSITIPASVAAIGGNVFFSCTSLAAVTWDINSGITETPLNMFNYCSALTSIDFIAGIKTISTNTFGYCTGLKNITIPASVTSLASNAFTNCMGLTEITIPATITDGTTLLAAFGNCANIKRVIFADGFNLPINASFFTSFADGLEVILPSSLTAALLSGTITASATRKITIYLSFAEPETGYVPAGTSWNAAWIAAASVTNGYATLNWDANGWEVDNSGAIVAKTAG